MGGYTRRFFLRLWRAGISRITLERAVFDTCIAAAIFPMPGTLDLGFIKVTAIY